MIETIYGRRKEVTCDNCGDGFECEDFEDAMRIMNADGWKKSNKTGEWRHYCPECVKEAVNG